MQTGPCTGQKRTAEIDEHDCDVSPAAARARASEPLAHRSMSVNLTAELGEEVDAACMHSDAFAAAKESAFARVARGLHSVAPPPRVADSSLASGVAQSHAPSPRASAEIPCDPNARVVLLQRQLLEVKQQCVLFPRLKSKWQRILI